MLTAIVFVAILAVLIIVHEFGHFIAARKSGVKVEEFSIGFPPRIWKKQKGETVYSVGMVPLGGFVKIFGEDESELADPRAFGAQPAWRRAIMLVAGVFMNFLLAYVLITVVQFLGVPTAFEGSVPSGAKSPRVRIVEVQKDSPAFIAGLEVGDAIIGISSPVKSLRPAEFIGENNALEQIQNFIGDHKGQELLLNIERGSSSWQVSVAPRVNVQPGEGALGIAMLKVAQVPTPWYLAPWEGLKSTGNLVALFGGAIFDIFREMFTHGRLAESISGPVGIVKITSQTLPLGWLYVLQLVAILSLNLAVLNIMPFPALDGGRLLFLGIEKIRNRPIRKEVEYIVNAVGFFLLILFMVFVTIKDIGKLF